jgi:hypothetical protein
MSRDFDGLAVLRVIAATPKLLPDATKKIDKVARDCVAALFKPATLERLREIYSKIGVESFSLILDAQDDKASASLVKNLDKENPGLKTAPPEWCRKRLAELASGAAGPAEKPPKKGKKPGLTPEQENLATELKAKTINLDKARALWRETGEASFTLVLARLTEKQTRDLAKRLDKDNPDLMSAPLDQLRQRIEDLASGAAEPAPKASAKVKGTPKTRPKAKTENSLRNSKPHVQRALGSKVFTAKWDGKNRDD